MIEEVAGEAQDVVRLVLQDLMNEDADHISNFRMSQEVLLVLHIHLDLRQVQLLLLLLRKHPHAALVFIMVSFQFTAIVARH